RQRILLEYRRLARLDADYHRRREPRWRWPDRGVVLIRQCHETYSPALRRVRQHRKRHADHWRSKQGSPDAVRLIRCQLRHGPSTAPWLLHGSILVCASAAAASPTGWPISTAALGTTRPDG